MTQKFIDRDGLKVLWKQTSLQDYPNNETLMAVIDAIDETKSDKNHTHTTEDIEGLEETINDISKAIIDVVELPKEDICEDCFYRLVSAEFVYNEEIYSDWIIQCVDELPESPEPVSKDNVNIYAYYNTEDNDVYGYVDDFVSQAGGGIPTGWYTLQQLAPAFNLQWIGVITHIDDAKEDDSWKALLSYSLHIYKDGWKELPYAYESAPEFDIKWDGEIGDKFALDLTSLGNPGYYLVKISDSVFTEDELLGAVFSSTYYDEEMIINEDMIDTAIYPGAITIDGGVLAVVNDSDTLNAALGTPSGYITDGTYFVYYEGGDYGDPFWTNRLVGKKKITKIDSKFINIDTDALDNLATVATTGSYNDLSNKPTIYTDVVRYGNFQSLSSTNKSRARANIDVYSKSEVDTKIANVNLNEYIKTTEVDEKLTDYAKTTEVDEKLTDYAKTTEVDEKLTDYAKTTEVDEKLTDYAKTTELTKYAKTTEVDNKLKNYATTTEVDEKLKIEENLPKQIRRMCYGNNVYVAHDRINNIIISLDGIKWEFTNNNIVNIANLYYINEKFIILSQEGKLYESIDGISWTHFSTLSSSYKWGLFAYGNGVYVAIPRGVGQYGNYTNKAFYSEDCTNWIEMILPITEQWQSLCYKNNVFVASTQYPFNSGCNIIHSVDGINWNISLGNQENTLIKYENGQFFACSGDLYNSIDGVTWNKIEIDFEVFNICYFNNVYLLYDIRNNCAMRSDDLINFEVCCNNLNSYTLFDCVNDKVYALQDNNTIYSTDTSNWQNVTRVFGIITQSNQDVTSEVAQLIQQHLSLTAEDVGALPADTVIPSIEGLATESYVAETIQTYINESILGGEW